MRKDSSVVSVAERVTHNDVWVEENIEAARDNGEVEAKN